MMIMTAKVDLKKILMIIAAIAAVLLAVILMLGGGSEETAATSAPSISSNDGRVQFLKDFGWQVTTTPVQTGQVRIPEESGEVFDRYNILQKSQGYDLSEYAGKKVMRYVYRINNYPGSSEPVYATLLVYKNRIIGGDVTDTAAKGQIRGFKMPEASPTETTAPQDSSAATHPAA